MTGIDLYELIKLLNDMQEWMMSPKLYVMELALNVIHMRYQLILILKDIVLLHDMQ